MRQAVIGLVVVAMLAVDVAWVAPPEPAQAAQARRSAEELPALPSDPPPSQAPEIPKGDYRGHPEPEGKLRTGTPVPAFDPSKATELPELTTPVQRVFRNPDGTETAVVHAAPVRFQDPSGAWRDIDLTLVEQPDGTLAAKASPLDIRFGPKGAGDVAVVASPAGPIILRHPDALPAPARPDGGRARFADALPGGRELRLTLNAGGFEEDVILPAAGLPASYIDEFVLPAGVEARSGGPGVEFVANGEVVGSFGGGYAYDAPTSTNPDGIETPVTTRLVAQTGGVAVVEVGIDPGWLSAPERVFPVTIDPSYYYGNTNHAGASTFVHSGYPNTSYWGHSELRVGRTSAGVTRSLLRFNHNIAADPQIDVLESHVDVFNNFVYTCAAREVHLRGLAGPFNSGTTWNNQPAFDGFGVVSAKSFYHSDQCPSSPNGWESLDTTALAQRWLDGTQPSHGLALMTNEDDQTFYKKFASGYADWVVAPALYITYQRPPPVTTPVAPADATTFTTTTTPTLSVNPVTDPDGDPVSYWFRVTTGSDAESGSFVAESGWTQATSWQIPRSALRDGTTYYWHTYTADNSGYRNVPWVRNFKIDLRLGTSGPSPMDSAGPATVNLATGNLAVETGTPSFPTVGGSLGLTFAYNSKAPSTAGLAGAYYWDLNGNRAFDADENPSLQRIDPAVDFNWGTGSPYPAIRADQFLARWNGFVTIPADAPSGDYFFGARQDDGVRIWVNNTLVVDRWSDQASGPNYGSSLALKAGQTVPIRIEYYEAYGGAFLQLYVKQATLGEKVVPASWLSTTPVTLPQGWTLSADLDGALAYSRALINGSSVTLLAPDGSTEEYTRTNQGWKPPAGSDGVLTMDAQGRLTLHDEDGMVYGFEVDGTLTSATSGIDDRKPAAAVYTWSGSPKVLTRITDPVSTRAMTLRYGGDPACPTSPPPGFDAGAPPGMLCSVAYWDGTETKLWYAAGQLGRLADPGGEITDFAYSGGRLSAVRDPLAGDAVAAGVRVNDASTSTAIAYDAAGRVSSVTLPAPSAGAPRPQTTYRYVSATETQLDVAGAPQPHGYARKVTFDGAGRAVTETDATALTSRTEWDPVAERVLSSTDPAGRKTTTIYDTAGRPTDAFGPAPASCFGADRRPNGTCTNPSVAHSQTSYDEGIRGLAVSYWDNQNLTGPPKVHATGVVPDGTLAKDWGWGGPPGLVDASGAAVVDWWSARFSGEILLPEVGKYQLFAWSDDGVRVYVDDILVTSTGRATGSNAARTWR